MCTLHFIRLGVINFQNSLRLGSIGSDRNSRVKRDLPRKDLFYNAIFLRVNWDLSLWIWGMKFKDKERSTPDKFTNSIFSKTKFQIKIKRNLISRFRFISLYIITPVWTKKIFSTVNRDLSLRFWVMKFKDTKTSIILIIN